jgi:hypothetical protein
MLSLLPTLALTVLLGQAPDLYYGSEGVSEGHLGGGASLHGFMVGGGFRHFVWNGVGPGMEAAFLRHRGHSRGLAMASVRFVPFAFRNVYFVATVRGGRALADRLDDGWIVGGDVAALFFVVPSTAVELAVQVLRQLPTTSCHANTGCTFIHPLLSLRILF